MRGALAFKAHAGSLHLSPVKWWVAVADCAFAWLGGLYPAARIRHNPGYPKTDPKRTPSARRSLPPATASHCSYRPKSLRSPPARVTLAVRPHERFLAADDTRYARALNLRRFDLDLGRVFPSLASDVRRWVRDELPTVPLPLFLTALPLEGFEYLIHRWAHPSPCLSRVGLGDLARINTPESIKSL